jgi:hypothetical protein
MKKLVNKGLPLDRTGAETIAAQGLAFLASDVARLSRFLALTGLDASGLRDRVDTPEMLSAVLEHLVHDESLLLIFSAEAGIAPERIGPALALLQASRP